ncbi:MAG: hypothetical protein PHX20_08235, partial [Candidatus Omnitrophica bacterium]|nr:hypothetical protein [Candidatus Omnitrophota bacterium]
INTPMGRYGKDDDSYIRMMAIQYKIPYITTMAAAKAAVDGIKEVAGGEEKPMALQEYHHKSLKEKEPAGKLAASAGLV